MLKFTYVLFLTVTSLLLFIFSKEKTAGSLCPNETGGTVTMIADSAGSYLGVVTDNNILLRPTSMNEEIVLAAGQKVTICYKVDSSNLSAQSGSFVPVHIEAIKYNP